MQSFDTATVADWLARMGAELLGQLSAGAVEDVGMIGIHSGGVRVARALHDQLGLQLPPGTLNISFYRDDFSRIGLHPQVAPSQLPFAVEGRTIVLVDDVLYSGRTVRAALNEIFDYGRPARVLLAVLVERQGHELPIRADVAGARLALAPQQQVKLAPDALSLSVQDVAGRTP